MTAMTHWAAPLIGLPYRRGAAGPDAFDCWGLVRHVFATRWGIQMPPVEVADSSADNVAAIKRAAAVSGWAPVTDDRPADGDIVLMNSLEGRHVGVMVDVDGALCLLHCVEDSGVRVQTLASAHALGMSGFAFWRREA